MFGEPPVPTHAGLPAQLQKHLEEEEAKVAKLQAMLPDENGEFKSLRAELDELERVRALVGLVLG